MSVEAPAQEKTTFFPIPLGVMQPGTQAPVNLYLRSGGEGQFVLYKKAGDPLPEENRGRLLEHGVATLFLRTSDEKVYHQYVETYISAIIRDDLMPAKEAAQLVYECSSRVMEEVFDDPRSGLNLQRAHNMVEATVLSVLKNPESLWHMTSIATHDYYTYTHCVNVAMFMVAASQDIIGITDQRTLERIGLGAMLHDIGKSQIPEAILAKPGKLTPEEFETIKAHPAMGLDLVARARHVPATAALIIHHHHERYNGSGYPLGLSGNGISELARLATVCDVYDALTTNRSYAKAREPYQAVALMLNEMNGHFDMPVLKAFVKFLGPRECREELRRRWNATVGASLGVKVTG